MPEAKIVESRAELSKDAIAFLTKLFDFYKSQETGSLDDLAFDRIFHPNEGGVPWDFKNETVS